VTRTSNNGVIAARELYCYLLPRPRCEALRTCRSGFSDRNTANTRTIHRGKLGMKLNAKLKNGKYVRKKIALLFECRV